MGINYFDTSESYGHGEAERQLGTALKSLNANRQDLVVSTKIFWGSPDSKVNTIGTSRKHVLEGLNNSLKRL